MGNKFTVALTVAFTIVLLVVLVAASNPVGYHEFLKEGHNALVEVAHAVWVGIQILFWTALVLGVLYALIKLNQMRNVRVIGPSKHGPQQALVKRDGTIEHLTNLQAPADAMLLFQLLQKSMQMNAATASATAQLMKRIGVTIGQEEEEAVEAGPPPDQKRLPPPPGGQVRLSQVLGKLTRNALQVYWGRKEDGTDCILDLPSSTHIQKSGLTGLGKSYLTMAELICLHVMNDPDVIRFAYIDLECETTEPFHKAPHTWTFAHRSPQGDITVHQGIKLHSRF